MSLEYIDSDYSNDIPDFRSPNSLAKVIVVVLIVLASFKFTLLCLSVLNQMVVGTDVFAIHTKDYDRIYYITLTSKLIGICTFLVFIALIILFQMWCYRAYRNAYYSTQHSNWKPYWSVLGWFVPILNWFLPPLILSRTWLVAQNKAISDDRLKSGSEVIWIWWALFVLTILIRMFYFISLWLNLLYSNSTSSFVPIKDVYQAMPYLNIIEHLLNIASLLTLAYIVRNIHSFEMTWNKKLESEVL